MQKDPKISELSFTSRSMQEAGMRGEIKVDESPAMARLRSFRKAVARILRIIIPVIDLRPRQ